MNIEGRLQRLRCLMEEWPVGQVVYHRACGKRGIVQGHVVHGQGNVALRIDCGSEGWGTELPESLQATKPGIEDGEEWRDDGDGADGADGAVGAGDGR